MARARTLLLGFFLISAAVTTSAGQSDPNIDTHLDELMTAHSENNAFSGAVLIADASGVLLEKGYGFANLDWRIPNTPETRYRVGSITKQFTAAMVLELAENGALTLDAKLTDVLPWYRADTGSKVTIRQLLNHTSGIDRSGVMKMIQEHACCPMPLREEVETFCSGDLESEPGADFAYNNAGYLILGAVIEEVTGMSYAEAFEKLILDPLDMNDTGLENPDLVLERRATGYDVTDGVIRAPMFIHATLAASAGGVYSTVGDLYTWDRALAEDRVLSKATRTTMFTPVLGQYGMGWFVMQMPVGPDGAERTVIRHPGQGDGFQSIFWRIPEDDITIILINNVGKPSLPTIATEILDAIHGPVGGPRLASNGEE